MTNGFIFYESFYKAFSMLDGKNIKLLLDRMCKYQFEDDDTPCQDVMIEGMFQLIKAQIDANNEKRLNGKKGGAPKGNKNAKKEETDLEQPEVELKQPEVELKQPEVELKQPKVNVKVKENVNVKVKENVNVIDATSSEVASAGAPQIIKRFKPPTKEELDEYCTQHDLWIDTERFLDYYTSNGWSVGRNKMKDWKAAARNWARNQNMRASPSLPKEDCGNVFLQLAKEEGLIQ